MVFMKPSYCDFILSCSNLMVYNFDISFWCWVLCFYSLVLKSFISFSWSASFNRRFLISFLDSEFYLMSDYISYSLDFNSCFMSYTSESFSRSRCEFNNSSRSFNWIYCYKMVRRCSLNFYVRSHISSVSFRMYFSFLNSLPIWRTYPSTQPARGIPSDHPVWQQDRHMLRLYCLVWSC